MNRALVFVGRWFPQDFYFFLTAVGKRKKIQDREDVS